MGFYIRMSGIGDRLREERERLGLSQGAFGELGGVKANAQGNYEKGDRFPDAAYLASVAEQGVDVLYVITGGRLLPPTDSLTAEEAEFLHHYRQIPAADRAGLNKIAAAMAAMGDSYQAGRR